MPPRCSLSAIASLLAVLGLFAAPCFGDGPEIRGRVVQDEVPVQGAWVELTPLVGRWHLGDLFFQGKTRPEPVRRAVTAADGTYSLPATEAGMWRLTVGADGRVPVQLSLVPLYRDVELDDAKLTPDHGVTVRVVDPVGRPVSGAAVLGYGSGSSRRGRNGLPEPTWQRATELAFTGEDGLVRLSGRRGETLRLQVAEPDHASATAEVRLPVPGELEVQLDRGRRLTVRATGASDEPLAGALVWLGDQPFPVGWTGDDGRTSMVLPRSAPSSDSVRLRGLTESGARAVFALSTSSPVDSLRLPFRWPEPFGGRVLRQGTQEPVAGALVWSWYLPDRFVRSDSDGWFHLDSVDPGAYVSAVRAGYRPSGLHLSDDGSARSAVVQLTAVGSLSGLVIDNQGEPVPGLGLRLARRDISWGQNGWPHRSGPDGTFLMRDLPVDAELLLTLGGVDTSGRAWAEVARVVEPLAPGEARTGVLLLAARGLSAVGWVVDESEVPVAGAQVRLVESDARRHALRLPTRSARETKSAADGSWKLEALRSGSYSLVVKAAGFAPAIVPGIGVGSLDPKDAGAWETGTLDLGTVVLVPGTSLAGWVADADHRDVPGAEVRAWESGRLAMATSSVTDDQGRFVLKDLRPGATLHLAADHPEYLEGRAGPIDVPVPGEFVDDVEIVLARGTSLSGRVTDEIGRPVSRAGIALFAQGGGGSARSGQSTAVTDREGRFILEQVSAGPATLQVHHRDYPSHSEPVDLLPSHLGLNEVDVVLRETAGRVRGVVHDADGLPVAAALVLLPGDGVVPAASGRTDAEGAFEIARVDPGRRELVVHHASFASYRTELDVTPSSWIEIELDHGVSVSGVVVDDAGAPLAGARIDTTPLDAAGGATREGAVSAVDGTWTVERLVPGRYRLRARAEGYYTAEQEEPTLLDEDLAGVRLELRRGVALEGRVVGADFDQLADLKIVARSVSPDIDDFVSAVVTEVDFEGGFRLEGLSPGTWRVSVGHMSFGGPSSAEVVVGTDPPEPVTLRLGEGYRVGGALRLYGAPAELRGDPLGQHAGMLRVTLRCLGDVPCFSMRVFDRDGRFEFDDVPRGEYEMLVASGSGRLWEREIDVQGDMDLDIEARVGSLAGTVRDELGRPLGDVWVLLYGTRLAAGGETSETTISSSTGDDGRFRIEVLPAGAYTLRLARNGFRHNALQLSIIEGSRLDVEFVMQATGR